MRKHFIAPACLIFLLAFTTRNSKTEKLSFNNKTINRQDTSAGMLTIDLNSEYQTIHSFGASDCWTAKYAGKW
jgi:hypothetical protein